MLETRPLKTYQYPCSRLHETIPVDTFVAYYSDSLAEYPQDAQIPFAATFQNMSCRGMSRCGIMLEKEDGTTQYAWHLCPALATLKEKYFLPETDSDERCSSGTSRAK
jgi:hypothetical protein